MNKFTNLLLAPLALFVACSNPLDKEFKRETAEADFIRIVKLKKIDSTEASMMAHFMVEHDLIGTQALEIGATYKDILEESKVFWRKSNPKKTVDEPTQAKVEEINQSVKVNIQPINSTIQKSQWSHSIKYHLIIENKSGKKIKALKGNFTFFDAFDEQVYSIEYKYLDLIDVSEKIEKDINLRIENIISSRKLLEYGLSNPFTVRWEPSNIIFE
jgi:hypothetical protein